MREISVHYPASLCADVFLMLERCLGRDFPDILLHIVADDNEHLDRMTVLDQDNIVLEYALPIKLGQILDQILRLLDKQSIGWSQKESAVLIGPYIFDARAQILIDERTQKQIMLTEKEVLLLETLLAAGEPLERSALLSRVWGYVPETQTQTLETHIYRLRQKLEDDPGNPRILCHDGHGYFLRM